MQRNKKNAFIITYMDTDMNRLLIIIKSVLTSAITITTLSDLFIGWVFPYLRFSFRTSRFERFLKRKKECPIGGEGGGRNKTYFDKSKILSLSKL